LGFQISGAGGPEFEQKNILEIKGTLSAGQVEILRIFWGERAESPVSFRES
jgi:hypothetical protein